MTELIDLYQPAIPHVHYAELENLIHEKLGRAPDLAAIEEWGNDSSYGPYSAGRGDPDDAKLIEAWLIAPLPDPNDPHYADAQWRYSLDVRDAMSRGCPPLYSILDYMADKGFIPADYDFYVDVSW